MSVISKVRLIVSCRLGFLAALAVIVAGAAFGDVVIPSSVYRRGAGGAEFRSDVRVFNPTSSPIDYTPILYDQVSGQTLTGQLRTIPARAQQSFDNIVGTVFGKTLDDGSFGPIRFQTSGALVVSSSVNNYNACGNGAVSGQWLPGLDATAAVNAGTLVQLASSVDLLSGYRTNVVFTNPGTQSATVTAKVRKGDGSQLSSATLDPLGANGFVQIGNWGSFPGVAGTADTNLWLEFTSDQPVLAFASVINNASGDPFAIVMTAEPNVSSSVPVASYTVDPASPSAGQAATFTDTSTNSPTVQLWAFGDGTTATSGAAVQHTYAAAGTYRTTHFVSNANGTSAAVKDVVVASAAPLTFTVSATTNNNTNWTFTPSSVTCKVNVPCKITWTTPQSENNHHGVGGLGALGITRCDDGGSLDNIIPSHACTVTFTPTSFALNNQPAGGWVYACTQTQCAPLQAQHNNMTGKIVIVP
jgi:PKD repeat protein